MGDLFCNNWFIGILVYGEGWYNNYYVFEFSVRYGLRWW